MDYLVKENALIIKLDSKASASLVFHVEGKRFYIDSTYTPEAYRGRGIGGQLMQAAMDYAKSRDLKIVPVCSFSVEYFKKHTEYADQLLKS
jgi:hypothetical protein